DDEIRRFTQSKLMRLEIQLERILPPILSRRIELSAAQHFLRPVMTPYRKLDVGRSAQMLHIDAARILKLAPDGKKHPLPDACWFVRQPKDSQRLPRIRCIAVSGFVPIALRNIKRLPRQ